MRLRFAALSWTVAVGISVMVLSAACNDDSLVIILPSPTPPTGPVVYVTGEVASPGVYTLPPGAERIFDAIEAAGGFSPLADVDSVNLAEKLTDGQHIRVLAIGASDAGGGIDGSTEGSLININTASSELLRTLNGIGPAKAEDIIDYRERNGPFERIEDILNVPGIGEKTFEAIGESITVK